MTDSRMKKITKEGGKERKGKVGNWKEYIKKNKKCIKKEKN